MIITEETPFPYASGHTFVVTTNGDDVTVKKRIRGQLVEVTGSPLSDGQELLITTHSRDSNLHIAPVNGTSDVTLTRVES